LRILSSIDGKSSTCYKKIGCGARSFKLRAAEISIHELAEQHELKGRLAHWQTVLPEAPFEKMAATGVIHRNDR
jgi:hypothetical protein